MIKPVVLGLLEAFPAHRRSAYPTATVAGVPFEIILPLPLMFSIDKSDFTNIHQRIVGFIGAKQTLA